MEGPFLLVAKSLSIVFYISFFLCRRNNPELTSGAPRRFVANGAPPSVFSRLNPNLGNFRESKFSQPDKPETDLHVRALLKNLTI